MENKGYNKIETKAGVTKRGKLKWDERPDQPYEYWSEASKQELPLEEAYLPLSGEVSNEREQKEHKGRVARVKSLLRRLGNLASNKNVDELKETFPRRLDAEDQRFNEPEDDYDARIKRYQKTIESLSQASDSPKLGEDYPYSGSNIGDYGYRFTKYKTSNNPDLKGLIELKNEFKQFRNDLEDRIARYYVGPLSFTDHTDVKGAFQGFGESRYSKADMRTVENQRGIFAKKDQNDSKTEAIRREGKKFEGLFFTLFESGFFNLNSSNYQANAQYIIPSEYDDYTNKADTALYIPILQKKPKETKSENKEDNSSEDKKEDELIVKGQLIAFDLTVGTGSDKIDGIKDFFDRKHGLTDIKYPSDCFGRELPPEKDVPHFVLCLPWKAADEGDSEFKEFKDGLIGAVNSFTGKKKTVPDEILFLINYQIREQADIAAEYWTKQPNGQENAERFARISNYFQLRQNACQRRIGQPLKTIRDRHATSLAYLARLRKHQ